MSSYAVFVMVDVIGYTVVEPVTTVVEIVSLAVVVEVTVTDWVEIPK